MWLQLLSSNSNQQRIKMSLSKNKRYSRSVKIKSTVGDAPAKTNLLITPIVVTNISTGPTTGFMTLDETEPPNNL